jgi:hypothetical protein
MSQAQEILSPRPSSAERMSALVTHRLYFIFKTSFSFLFPFSFFSFRRKFLYCVVWTTLGCR